MAIIFAWFPKNLQQHMYFKTSIIGKRTTQKYKKCDWSVKCDFATKIVYIIPKMTNLIFAFRKKKFILRLLLMKCKSKTK